MARRVFYVGSAIALNSLWLVLFTGCSAPTDSDRPHTSAETAGAHGLDAQSKSAPTRRERSPQPDDPHDHDVLPPPPRMGTTLVAVPLPDLSTLGAAVQRQLRDAQALLAEQCLQPGVPATQLGNGYGEMGRLYHAYDLLEAAEACYCNARALAPNDFRWCYCLADVYRWKGDPEKAIPVYEAALMIDGDYVPALVALGEIQLTAGRPDQAKPLFEQALRLDANAASLVGLGKIAAAQKDFDRAIRHFETALSYQPEATAVQYSLARAYRGKGDLEKAKTHALMRGETRAKVADPLLDALADLRTGVRHHVKRGVAAGKAGDLERAVAELRKAVEANPESHSPRLNLGTALALSGDEDGAIDQYRVAIRLKPTSPQAHRNLARLLAKRGDYDQAGQHYRQAIQCDPEYLAAHLGLADLLAGTGDHSLAAFHYGRAVEIDPRHLAAKLAQVIALSRSGSHQEAYRRLKEARTERPKSVALSHAMARLLATCPDDALRDGERALELALSVFKSRNSPQHASTVAMAYAETGNFEEAVRWQNEIVQGAEQTGRDDLLPQARKYLALFRDRQACRNPWPADLAPNPPR